jgi:hypothetical protein
MYTARERRSNCFCDLNGFVEDPRQAHTEYRERLCWTEEERTVFVEKWRAHPKDFMEFKNALPEKSHKNVIEFYYLNRFEFNLRDLEGGAKKRGGKRKEAVLNKLFSVDRISFDKPLIAPAAEMGAASRIGWTACP